MIWIQLLFSAVLVVLAGIKLSGYVNVISEKSGLSKAFAGMVLLGGVTSLPEVTACLASVIKLDAPDLALGNLLGSNLFNLMIIAFLDLIYLKGSITKKVGSNQHHAYSGIVVLILNVVVIASIFINGKIEVVSVANIGLDSIIIVFIYLVGLRLIYKSGKSEPVAPSSGKGTLLRAVIGFVIAAAVVVASGTWLANIGEDIARETGMSRTFVGSLFLAVVTSFPEAVVCIAAFRLGSIDMAIGNIFGSNMINIFIIPVVDIAYRKGAILAAVSQNHILTATFGMICTCAVILGLVMEREKKFLHIGWDSIVVVVCYIVGMFWLFNLG